MCGVVGALTFQNGEYQVTEPYIVQMRDVMAHRGPDGAGVWISEDARVGLGNRRLSIIDLAETANQPMSNEDATIWISFNGEIYNHVELRSEIEQIGNHRWKTDHSDTEMILHAFEEWGINCIDRFRGQFAFALWDGRNRELWLVRDRIGIKPLYYSIHHGRITFASEIKALLQDPHQERIVNEEALFHYLSFLATPAPQTFFEGIQKVPGGTWLKITEDGSIESHRYWDVWDHTTPLDGVSDDEISERILEKLRESVELRKVSDVPVGVFLSGGIDSSTNTVLFSQTSGWPIRTFSIGYDREYQSYRSELEYARTVAQMVDAEHHERILSMDDLVEFLPRMVMLQDEPIADPVCVPLYYLSELARQNGVTVCQVGEGADELFFGYPGWQTSLRLQRLNDLPVPNSIKQAGLKGLQWSGNSHTFPYEWLRRGISGLPIFWGGAEAYTENGKRRVLSTRLRRKFAGYSSWEVIRPIRSHFEQNSWDSSSHLAWMTYLDLRFRLPELLLMRIDKMSMGVGLEGRVPFLDHQLIELVMSIPESVKYRNGVPKHIFKKAVKDLLPSEVIDRKKQGFGVPIHEWFLGELGQRARRELKDLTSETDFFDPSEIDRLFKNRRSSQIWYLLNFALWWKEYILQETAFASRL